MVDRRLLVVATVVAVCAVGVRATVTGPPPPADDLVTIDEVTAWPDQAARPETAVSRPVMSASPSTSEAKPPAATTPKRPAATNVATANDVADLVEKRRPTIDQIAGPAEHHFRDGEHSAHANATSGEHLAAELIIAGWSWRFDDTADRQIDAISGHATNDVTAMLAPSEIELNRRTAASEVSWVIIRELTVAGDEVTVVFDHHIVGDGTPESVTQRSVTVIVDDHAVTDMRL